ncbi:MAG: hypothetical protein JWM62_3321 [Frankiales bacterium]|nr:hypothetical protein [Frankiales bacterium]
MAIALRHPLLQEPPVAVGTVYDPSDGMDDAAALRLPRWSDAVSVIGRLNDALCQVAIEHGAAVVEIAQHFHGHVLLAPRPEARVAQREPRLCSVIEPNAWGASGHARPSGTPRPSRPSRRAGARARGPCRAVPCRAVPCRAVP